MCTTWGLKGRKLFLLDVYRHKLEFPVLSGLFENLAMLHHTNVVLIEDKASGTSLIQELHAENLAIAQAAPAIDGDKVMRLQAQTAKIEGGFVYFPREAHWLNVYLNEYLTGFPNSKYDDQVDFTVFALAWLTSVPTCVWTDEALKGLDNFVSGLAISRFVS